VDSRRSPGPSRPAPIPNQTIPQSRLSQKETQEEQYSPRRGFPIVYLTVGLVEQEDQGGKEEDRVEGCMGGEGEVEGGER
jgi:hypothetical protein